MSRFSERLDVLFGGSGRRRDDYNPYQDKADVVPAPNVVRINPPEPNPFGDDPTDSAAQPDPTAPAPPNASIDTQDCAQEKPDNPYRRRVDSDVSQSQPEVTDQLDAELQQLFQGYALRWRRRINSARDTRPDTFYDLMDVRGFYSHENPDKTDAEITQLIARDIETGYLVITPMMLDFSGEPIGVLSPDHQIAKDLWSQYCRLTGKERPDSPDSDPQPDAATTSQTTPTSDSAPTPQPAPPTEPTPDPSAETPTSAADTSAPSDSLKAEAEAIFGSPTGVPAASAAISQDLPSTDMSAPRLEHDPEPIPAPQPAETAPAPEPAPAPMPAPQSPAIGLEAIISALPPSERNAFYAQLAREVVYSGGLNAQDLAKAMTATLGHTEASASHGSPPTPTPTVP